MYALVKKTRSHEAQLLDFNSPDLCYCNEEIQPELYAVSEKSSFTAEEKAEADALEGFFFPTSAALFEWRSEFGYTEQDFDDASIYYAYPNP